MLENSVEISMWKTMAEKKKKEEKWGFLFTSHFNVRTIEEKIKLKKIKLTS